MSVKFPHPTHSYEKDEQVHSNKHEYDGCSESDGMGAPQLAAMFAKQGGSGAGPSKKFLGTTIKKKTPTVTPHVGGVQKPLKAKAPSLHEVPKAKVTGTATPTASKTSTQPHAGHTAHAPHGKGHHEEGSHLVESVKEHTERVSGGLGKLGTLVKHAGTAVKTAVKAAVTTTNTEQVGSAVVKKGHHG